MSILCTRLSVFVGLDRLDSKILTVSGLTLPRQVGYVLYTGPAKACHYPDRLLMCYVLGCHFLGTARNIFDCFNFIVIYFHKHSFVNIFIEESVKSAPWRHCRCVSMVDLSNQVHHAVGAVVSRQGFGDYQFVPCCVAGRRGHHLGTLLFFTLATYQTCILFLVR